MVEMTAATCVGCGRPIFDRYVLAAQSGLLQWHTGCLRCAQCGQLIDESSRTCFVRHRNVYCSLDFHRSVSQSVGGNIVRRTSTLITSAKSLRGLCFHLLSVGLFVS